MTAPKTKFDGHTPADWRWSGREGQERLIQTNHVTRDIWEVPHCPADMALIAAAPREPT